MFVLLILKLVNMYVYIYILCRRKVNQVYKKHKRICLIVANLTLTQTRNKQSSISEKQWCILTAQIGQLFLSTSKYSIMEHFTNMSTLLNVNYFPGFAHVSVINGDNLIGTAAKVIDIDLNTVKLEELETFGVRRMFVFSDYILISLFPF